MKFSLTAKDIRNKLKISDQRLKNYRDGFCSEQRALKEGEHFIRIHARLFLYSPEVLIRLKAKPQRRKSAKNTQKSHFLS